MTSETTILHKMLNYSPRESVNPLKELFNKALRRLVLLGKVEFNASSDLYESS